MTGDGVNDASALRQSSIGISMGMRATEVAKESSDLIILDDNFSTIISAIEEGRSIYANMKAFIRYMISSNLGEVLSILFSSLFGLQRGLSSIQLLWVNFVTDGLPAMALSFNKPDPDALKKRPRRQDEGLLDNRMALRYLAIGLFVGFATFLGGILTQKIDFFHQDISASEIGNLSSTVSLTVLVLIEMWNSINALSENQSIFTVGLFSNMWLWGAITLSIGTHLMIIYVGLFCRVFGTVPLTARHWFLAAALSLPVVLLEEIIKFFERKRLKFIQKISKKID